MAPVAERLVLAQSAAAKANGRASRQIECFSLGIDDSELTFDPNRTIVENYDFG